MLSQSLLFLALSLQSAPAPFPGAEAQAEMARLAPLEGAWTVEVYQANTEGGWTLLGEEHTRIEFMFNDLTLREHPAEDGVHPYRLETTLQYDQNRDVYRLAAMDDTWGNLDIFEGQWRAPDTLVMTNIKADTSFITDTGQALHFRLTTRIISEDTHEFLVEMTADRGESWQSFMRYNRTRSAIP